MCLVWLLLESSACLVETEVKEVETAATTANDDGSVSAAADAQENEPDADGEMEDEDAEDEEEPSDIQITWEVFETARTLCEQQDQNKEWALKRAEILCFLAEVSLLNDDFDKVVFIFMCR